MVASVVRPRGHFRLGRRPSSQAKRIIGMTSVETSASVLDASFAEPQGGQIRRFLAPIAVCAALVSASLTFVVLTELTPIRATDLVIKTLLAINSVSILLLVGLIVGEILKVVQARRRGRAAARLHIQTVALFAVIAVLPAVLVSVVANLTVDRELNRMFSVTTRSVIENSVRVAKAYLQAHSQLIGGDIITMANDMSRARPLFDQDRASFRELLISDAAARNLPGAMLIDANGTVLETVQDGIEKTFVPPPADFLSSVGYDEPQIVVITEGNYVVAVIRLRAFADTFLYVARLVDPQVVEQVSEAQQGREAFAAMEASRHGIQSAFALMFAVIALTVLTSAILIGLNFADRLVTPIRNLMSAASMVSTGNLQVQVPVMKSTGDLAQLGQTFNKMTRELLTQRDDLVSASDLIDGRRRFIEAVLSSASAGIIGVDSSGKIGVLNRSAEKLIGHSETETLGHSLSETIPELDELMASAREGSQRMVQGQITISRNDRERNLSVRISAEQNSQSRDSYIITLDDITELVTAQRTSAWGDVARRIAHEIKNPLTPIQLSAERIRRKFGKVITEDKAIFEQCTDTIVRQVDDIRRMVDEFSRFARMPKPVIEPEDVADTVRQVVFLMRVGHPDIDIEAEIKEDPMSACFDRRLISQALQNIIKNASEAISSVPPETLGRGKIDVVVGRENEDIVIDVIDNGIGLPKESRSRLLEPYVTTREKGTGLGLAIVGRVLEDHGGRIELNDASNVRPGARGAWMRLRFAASGQAAGTPTVEAKAEPAPEPAGITHG
jgi:two-component system, NtrC family, nitrogen regulation sensor histidine kinase NtrY